MAFEDCSCAKFSFLFLCIRESVVCVNELSVFIHAFLQIKPMVHIKLPWILYYNTHCYDFQYVITVH